MLACSATVMGPFSASGIISRSLSRKMEAARFPGYLATNTFFRDFTSACTSSNKVWSDESSSSLWSANIFWSLPPLDFSSARCSPATSSILKVTLVDQQVPKANRSQKLVDMKRLYYYAANILQFKI